MPLAGTDPAVAAERLEHSDGGALFHKTYRHLYEGEKREQAKKLEALQDDLEERIARLAEEENLDPMRPPLDGKQGMEHLGIEPGPDVGRALDHLMEIRLERGPIDEDEALRELDAWWRAERDTPGDR